MELFRLSKEEHSTSLSGIGSAMYPGRWNTKGVEIIYTSTSRALAMAEVLANLYAKTIPENYLMMTIYVPDYTSISVIQQSSLPKGWDANVPNMSSKLIGNKFISDNNYCLLKIPSAAVSGDFNILINPNHNEFANIKIIDKTPFVFDERLLKIILK